MRSTVTGVATNRRPELQTFIDSAEREFATRAVGEQSQRSVMESFLALRSARKSRPGSGARQSVCDHHLVDATDPSQFEHPGLAELAKAFLLVEPALDWRRRTGGGPAASDNFEVGHANAMIAGPDGLEPRTDVWLGVSLLAPHVRYPDHHHPPEETYLVMSAGEFAQSGDPWFSPGVGGSLYNPPGILHAMRVGPAPLFAFWLLRPEKSEKESPN